MMPYPSRSPMLLLWQRLDEPFKRSAQVTLFIACDGPLLIRCDTGYVFCAELMPATHELQLMLVNTLRKVC